MSCYVDKKRRAFMLWFPVWKHKTFEFQIELFGGLASMWELDIRHRTKCDHAGWFFSFSMLRLFFVEIVIHDNRHWDKENNQFQE